MGRSRKTGGAGIGESSAKYRRRMIGKTAMRRRMRSAGREDKHSDKQRECCEALHEDILRLCARSRIERSCWQALAASPAFASNGNGSSSIRFPSHCDSMKRDDGTLLHFGSSVGRAPHEGRNPPSSRTRVDRPCRGVDRPSLDGAHRSYATVQPFLHLLQ